MLSGWQDSRTLFHQAPPYEESHWGSFQGIPSQLQPASSRPPCDIPGARKGKGINGAQCGMLGAQRPHSPPSRVLCVVPTASSMTR